MTRPEIKLPETIAHVVLPDNTQYRTQHSTHPDSQIWAYQTLGEDGWYTHQMVVKNKKRGRPRK